MKSPRPIGIDSRRSRVPLRRSLSVADARDEEHHDEREEREHRWVRSCRRHRVSSKIHATSPMSRLGTTSSSAIVRGSLRICRRTRPAVAKRSRTESHCAPSYAPCLAACDGGVATFSSPRQNPSAVSLDDAQECFLRRAPPPWSPAVRSESYRRSPRPHASEAAGHTESPHP